MGSNKSYRSNSDLDLINDILKIISSSLIKEVDLFDEINYVRVTPLMFLIEYSLAGLCQFQVQAIIQDGKSWQFFKRVCLFDLLLENGDSLLQENGDKLLIEGLVP